MAALTLTPDELVNLTGYKQPAAQLAELHRQGYWRARRAPISGRVILTREHYLSVERGTDATPKQGRAPTLRAA